MLRRKDEQQALEQELKIMTLILGLMDFEPLRGLTEFDSDRECPHSNQFIGGENRLQEMICTGKSNKYKSL